MTDKIFHPLFRRLTTKQIGAGPCKTEGQPTQSTGNSHRRYDISFACMMGHTVRLKVLLNDGSLLARVVDSRGREAQPDQRRAGR